MDHPLYITVLIFICHLIDMVTCRGIINEMRKSKNNLSICAWNISGAFYQVEGDNYSKLAEPEVSDLLTPSDIFVLTETHCSPSDQPALDGFKVKNIVRPRSENERKNSGGISIGIKSGIKPGIKYLVNRT